MHTRDIPVGVVGLGLMGTSITSCLILSGHPVIAVAPLDRDLEHARERIEEHLSAKPANAMASAATPNIREALCITGDYRRLAGCRLVIETTVEAPEVKKAVYAKIEEVIATDALLTTNTSAIPISLLQQLTRYPERFYGLHWMEPAHTTRFLEIISGEKSAAEGAEYLYELARHWGKEATLVKKDIRGFITNRLMYAMYREACYLVEGGYASVEDVDRACRNNPGYWMTLAGVFRWMDLTGIQAYHAVMKDLLPTLSNETTVPRLIDDIVRAGGRGLENGKGFYTYSPQEIQAWKETYRIFSYEISELASRYPADVVEKKLEKEKKEKK